MADKEEASGEEQPAKGGMSMVVVLLVAVPHGLMEAVLSPGSQAAIANAASDRDAASAQGLAEAAGSAAAAAGAFTAPALFDGWGAGPAWVVAAVVMAVLLATSWLIDPPRPVGRLESTEAVRPAPRPVSSEPAS